MNSNYTQPQQNPNVNFLNNKPYPNNVEPNYSAGMDKPAKTGLNNWLMGLVAIVVVVAGGIGGFYYMNRDNGSNQEVMGVSTAIDSNTYQAVFLTNNQVYFGKVTEQNEKQVILTDIYYLRVNQALQPNPEATDAEAINDPQQELTLVKLGNELHGPEDEMFINRQHVLFIEDMKQDAKVMEAIREYQKNGGENNQNQQIQQ